MRDSVFQPKFRETSRISVALHEAETNARLIDRMLILPRHEGWTRRRVTSRRASATTTIEAVGEDAPTPEAARRAVDLANANAVRAYEFIDYVSGLPEQPIDELVLRQINREFLHGAVETLTPGVYRRGQNRVGNYVPPDQGDLPSLMHAFVRWLQRGTQHPLIAAGLAHLHLAALHPFWDGNGRTARGLEALVIQRSEFHCRRLLSMEQRLLDGRSEYFAAIERTLGSRYGNYDATPWLEYYLRTLCDETSGVVDQLTSWHERADELHLRARAAGLQERQSEVFFYLVASERVTRAEYMELTGVSAVTASRDLKRLADAGLIVAEGHTTSRTYRSADVPAATAARRSPGRGR
jgi:Fic family protein